MRRLLSSESMKRTMQAEKSGVSSIKMNKQTHWSHGLLDSINDPELKVLEDDRIVVIKDKYPKAKFHYLVLPKADIPSIHRVKKDNLNLLEHMEQVGQNLSKSHKDHEFIIGYHAIPSMHRLHLHVISTDFNSPCLKTKAHWNSFTTPFFLSSDKVRKRIQEDQHELNSEIMKKHLKTDLKCHKCDFSPKNMPDLKRHLLEHVPK